MSPDTPVKPSEPSLRRQLWRAKRAEKRRLRLALGFGVLVLGGVLAAALSGAIAPRGKTVAATRAPVPTAVEPEEPPFPAGDALVWSRPLAEAPPALLAVVPGEALEVAFAEEGRGRAVVAGRVFFRLALDPDPAAESLSRRFAQAGLRLSWAREAGVMHARSGDWSCLLLPPDGSGFTAVQVRLNKTRP